MKLIKYLLPIFAFALLSISCKKEETTEEEDHDHHTSTEYSATIMSPTASSFMIGDTMHIMVNFASGTGETVHNVSVIVEEKTSGTELYNAPEEGHIHAEGEYMHHDHIVLSTENGYAMHSDYVIKARVWGHDADSEDITVESEFHIAM